MTNTNNTTLSDSPIRIGTRGSKLALWQAEYVATLLRKAGHCVELIILNSRGDADQGGLIEMAGEGIFTQTLQQALLAEQIDVAVHSLKDLPTRDVAGIALAAVPPRESVQDVLVSRSGGHLSELKQDARVGTSSPRREAQLQQLRKDLNIVPIRGNVDTRLQKLDAGAYDAIVLAEAGLNRLGLASRISERFPPHLMLPAPGQGALGIEIRSHDLKRMNVFRAINDRDGYLCVTAERSMLKTLQVGCSAPVGGWCHRTKPGAFMLVGAVIQGNQRIEASKEVNLEPAGSLEVERMVAERLGQDVACALIEQGALRLMAENTED